MATFYPRTDANLLDGPARILIAPYTQALPDTIDKVIAMVSPYAPVSAFVEIGHTLEGFQVSREISTNAYETEQSGGEIRSKVDGTSRTLSFQAAELRTDIVRVLEEGAADRTIAASTGKSAQKGVDFGAIETLSKYRVVGLALKDKDDATVTEPGGAKRGAIVAYSAFRAQLSAESAEVVIQKGELSGVPLSFDLFPDPADTDLRAGSWLFETPGTIS